MEEEFRSNVTNLNEMVQTLTDENENLKKSINEKASQSELKTEVAALKQADAALGDRIDNLMTDIEAQLNVTLG